ncbi:MAG: hypothetical protein KDD29_11475, partial [Flavobacteriales bacterium]|nr:hypothetical protein [Flavobacteriales bacterium]
SQAVHSLEPEQVVQCVSTSEQGEHVFVLAKYPVSHTVHVLESEHALHFSCNVEHSEHVSEAT